MYEMAKFRVDRDVEKVSGNQTFEVEAETLSEAYEKLKHGGEIVDHEINVDHISPLIKSEIYKLEE